MAFFTYILASRPGGAIYVGSTDDLRRRVEQHRAGAVSAHTKTYMIDTLVWFETHASREEAMRREKSIKRWRRAWKDQLVIEVKPDWRDVSEDIPI